MGLYGFTDATRQRVAGVLTKAENIAGFLLAHPNCQRTRFRTGNYDAPDQPSTPRDASAAAVTASALSRWPSLPLRRTRLATRLALDILRSLSSAAYAAKTGENSHFLLKHSVGSLPENSEIDVALNYADYYYLEALLRCRALDKP